MTNSNQNCKETNSHDLRTQEERVDHAFKVIQTVFNEIRAENTALQDMLWERDGHDLSDEYMF